MEKRMILAFVLSFVILLVWSFLFAPKQKEAPTIEEEARKRSEKTTESAKTSVLKPAISPVSDKEKEKISILQTKEKEVKIDTPLYIAIFSNAGATIKSFKLKRYFLLLIDFSLFFHQYLIL